MKTAEEILREKMPYLPTIVSGDYWNLILEAMEEYRSQPLPEQTERKDVVYPVNHEHQIPLLKSLAEKILLQMKEEMPYHLPDYAVPYVQEAIELGIAQSPYIKQPSEVSNEDIEKYADSLLTIDQTEDFVIGAKAMRDGKITHKQQ